jgi:hypothetical protein
MVPPPPDRKVDPARRDRSGDADQRPVSPNRLGRNIRALAMNSSEMGMVIVSF